MQFSLFFFGADSSQAERYSFFFEAAQFADKSGLAAIWVPERHFTRFGGLYGSPSVMAATLAATTRSIGIRAGSIVLPLHHPLRVAEEWSMVDNISNGRVAIAAASGWHVNDFVLAPTAFNARQNIMLENLSLVQKLWRGEKVSFINGEGRSIEIKIFPTPIQSELPIWLTTSSERGSRIAAAKGFNLLTSNFTHNYSKAELEKCISFYRTDMYARHGKRGHVTLMLHTYIAESQQAVEDIAVPAMARYLEANLDLQEEYDTGRALQRGYEKIHGRRRELLVNISARQNVQSELNFTAAPDICLKRAAELEQLGVDEIACLIDFGISADKAMTSLEYLKWINNKQT